MARGNEMVTDELATTEEYDQSMQDHAARKVLLPTSVCIAARAQIHDQIAELATVQNGQLVQRFLFEFVRCVVYGELQQEFSFRG